MIIIMMKHEHCSISKIHYSNIDVGATPLGCFLLLILDKEIDMSIRCFHMSAKAIHKVRNYGNQNQDKKSQ